MKKLVTAEMMKKLEEFAVKEYHLDTLELMNNAGSQVAEVILSQENKIEEKKVVVFCGKGNNGGDGLVAAELLLSKGADVNIYMLGLKSKLTPNTKSVFERMKKFHDKISFIKKYQEKYLEDCDIIIDAIFGTGFNANPEGIFFDTISAINQSSAKTYSIDIPSGINGTTGNKEDIAVLADYTTTLAYSKIGLYLNDGYLHSGEVKLLPIGFPSQLDEEVPESRTLLEKEDVLHLLSKRPLICDKKDFGKVFNFAGSLSMPGAAILSSMSALRTGCGLLKLGIPMNIGASISAVYPEIMTIPLAYTQPGYTSMNAEKEIMKGYKWGDAVLIGPGLHVNQGTKRVVKKMFSKFTEKPLVLDADALNILAESPELFDKVGAECVITPHNSEMGRLADIPKEILVLDRLGTVTTKAQEWGCYIILKGTPTLIATPTGEVKFHVNKMPAMAVGGMGDVLSGIIVSLMAQGNNSLDSISLALIIHQKAGELALKKKNERSLLPSDVIAEISNALDELESS